MSWKEKLKHELISVGIATLYFLIWFGFLMLIKFLLLEDYDIEFTGVSMVIVGALVVAKVILIMEYIPLGSWVKKQPAYVDVILRTVLYSLGVLVILILEKGFEGRHEYGGFANSLRQVFNHVDVYHVWVNSIVVSCALLSFNFLTLIRMRLGKGVLFRMLKDPLLIESK
jgi:hypothetical protein